MNSKIFCGSGRIISTNYGTMPKISLHKDDVNRIVKWMKENKSDWINLDMKEKRDPEQGKPTHYLEVDEWKPEKKQENSTIKPDEADDDDDLPF